jgi:putative transposase
LDLHGAGRTIGELGEMGHGDDGVHLKSTNMLERLNEEIKRRTRVVRIFPNSESCLRLIRAMCAETHETWLEGSRYLNMALLAEHK